MLVKIDKSGCDDEAADIDNSPPTKWFGRDASDLAIADRHVANGVQAGLGIHRAAALKNQVVFLGRENGGGKHQKAEKENFLVHDGLESKTLSILKLAMLPASEVARESGRSTLA
jgi:hypothetical protein